MNHEYQIERYLKTRARGVWVMVVTVCAALGMQKSSASRILKEWAEKGLLETQRIVKGRGRPAIAYRWKR